MALIPVTGRMVRSHGEDSTPLPESGLITFTPEGTGIYAGALRGADPVDSPIVEGVLEPVKLAPGYWRIVVHPEHSSRWRSFIIEIPEDSTGIDLATVAPAVEIDGQAIARGETGASAYELAVAGGYEGTESQWLASLAADPAVQFSAAPAGIGVVTITGPAVVPNEGTLTVYSDVDPAGAWSVNPLAQAQGRWLQSLDYDPVTNALYSGFGDWTLNGDYVGVVKHDILTGAASILYAPVASEAIHKVVRLGDALYVPHTDGSGLPPGCGYATDEGGTWHDVALPNGTTGEPIHIFDMAVTDAGMWACGSVYTGGSHGTALWFRPAGAGENGWQIIHQEADEARFYFIRVVDQTVWVQRSPSTADTVKLGFVDGTTPPTTAPADPGTEWRLIPTDNPTVTLGATTYRGIENGRIERTSA